MAQLANRTKMWSTVGEKAYFEAWIDFFHAVAEVIHDSKSLNVCEGFSGALG